MINPSERNQLIVNLSRSRRTSVRPHLRAPAAHGQVIPGQ